MLGSLISETRHIPGMVWGDAVLTSCGCSLWLLDAVRITGLVPAFPLPVALYIGREKKSKGWILDLATRITMNLR
jgi:hypothetical protein